MTVFVIMLISVNKYIEKVDLIEEKTIIGHIKIEIWVAVNGVFWNQVNSITG